MQRRGFLFLFIFILAFGVVFSNVIAQDEAPDGEDLGGLDGEDVVDEEIPERKEDFGDSGFDCAVALCQAGNTCVQGVGCVPEEDHDDVFLDELEKD